MIDKQAILDDVMNQADGDVNKALSLLVDRAVQYVQIEYLYSQHLIRCRNQIASLTHRSDVLTIRKVLQMKFAVADADVFLKQRGFTSAEIEQAAERGEG